MRQRSWLKSLAFGLCLLVTCALSSLPLTAQSFYGGVSGTVMDSTGAVVPNASVSIINLGTNETRKATSGAAGEFRFVNLVPANYKIVVEAQSFKRFEVQPVVVQVGITTRADASLQAGATTETVEVTTQTPLIQTESGTVGAAVEGQVVQSMPLNGRNVMNLITLTPGVVPGANTSGAPSDNGGNRTNTASWGSYGISGGFNNENSEWIDGASVNMMGQNLTGLVPNQDVIQEFRVDTSVPSAEYGRFGGGVINMTTKSGANAFHGSLYEYNRTTSLNATNTYSKHAGLAKPPYNQNQYGAFATGPIKKDKIFFMFGWENFVIRNSTPLSTNVPTVASRSGVFSDKNPAGAARVISDPSGKCTGITHDTVAGTYTIPQSCLDATSKVMMGYFPSPNNSNPIGKFNFAGQPGLGDNTSSYNGRIDYNLSEKHRIFGRYTYWKLDDIGQDLFGGTDVKFNTRYAATHNRTQQIVIGDTYTVNPTTIADLRVNYTRQYFTNPSLQLNQVDMSQFGPAYAALAPKLSYTALPSLTLTGTDSIYNMNPISGVEFDPYNNYGLNGSLTKIVGAHSFKFGFEGVLRQHGGTGYFRNPAGYSTFSNSTAGDEVASFYLGEFTTDVLQTIWSATSYNYYWGFYGTDTWKLTRNLTVNLGVRWDVPGGVQEKKDRATVILPNITDPITGVKGANTLVNTSLYPHRSVEPIQHGLVAPRLSFANSLPGNSVLRGGFGIAYLPPDVPQGLMAYTSPVNAGITTTKNGAVPTFFQANPFPTGILQPVGRTNPNFSSTLKGQAVSAPVPQDAYPYKMQWNLSFAKQWKGDWSTEMSYVGTAGKHLTMNVAVSMDQPSTANTKILQAYEYTQAGCAPPGPCSTAAQNATIAYATAQGMMPYPGYQNLSNAGQNTGASTYHSMYAVMQKRFHSAGLINANFTWGKVLTNTDAPTGASTASGGTEAPQDYTNLAAEKSVAYNMLSKRFLLNYVLNLPFGKGQAIGANQTGFVSALISGWGLNGITTVQSGMPLAIAYNGNNLTKNLNAGILRPNYVPGCDKKAGVPSKAFDRYNTNNWFNAACFQYPGDFTFGNQPRVDPTLVGQGQVNFDVAASKTTTIHENWNLQFRAEAFNIFNHPYYGNPGTTMAGSGYNTINTQNNMAQPRLIQLSLRLGF